MRHSGVRVGVCRSRLLGREALAIHRETGHRLGEARTLVALAHVLQKTDDAAAEPMRQQALDIFWDVGVPAEGHKDLDW